jgi:hypothetical protein
MIDGLLCPGQRRVGARQPARHKRPHFTSLLHYLTLLCSNHDTGPGVPRPTLHTNKALERLERGSS